ncbi:MAG: alpha-ketoacid dehydrogenase subunit beta [Chloroflexota bacterium]|nr:alpha-ketoacid dehydrogenase subunit beta [Chloroflexota bacterium]MDE3102749.1 alpha-ketoacid dehydrogenase subunit beta [Chloroflexota bacterium]
MPERVISFAQAIAEAVEGIMEEDPRFQLMGARFTGHTKSARVMDPIIERYADRISWPPISEIAYCGVAIGAAISGVRSIVEMSTATFSYEAIPQIVNEAAIVHANSNGRISAPVVFHVLYGIRGAGAAQHSGSPQGWYWSAPGLQVAMPATPADMKGLLRYAALRSKGPTVLLDHQRLMEGFGPVPEGPFEIPFGQASVEREGDDVTILGTSIQVQRALEAADILYRDHGLAAEVLDLRTLQPLDHATIARSVKKTGRVVVTDESPEDAGVATVLAGIVASEMFDSLRAPVKRVGVLPTPVPYAKGMEDFVTPRVDRIVAAALEVAKR